MRICNKHPIISFNLTFITYSHKPKSFLISSFTIRKYFLRFSFDTNGTDQN
jgi:hypothetical protein